MTFNPFIDEFFEIDDITTDVIATILGTPKTIKGIFDKAFKLVDISTGVESSTPAVTCKTEDIEGIKHNNAVTINSVGYRVSGITDDGTGITILLLSENSPMGQSLSAAASGTVTI